MCEYVYVTFSFNENRAETSLLDVIILFLIEKSYGVPVYAQIRYGTDCDHEEFIIIIIIMEEIHWICMKAAYAVIWFGNQSAPLFINQHSKSSVNGKTQSIDPQTKHIFIDWQNRSLFPIKQMNALRLLFNSYSIEMQYRNSEKKINNQFSNESSKQYNSSLLLNSTSTYLRNKLIKKIF